MLKKNKGLMILTSVIILLPMLAGILLWEQLPERMATHWGVNGEADGWSSRPVAVFGMPLFLLAIHWLGVWVTGQDRRNRKGSSDDVLDRACYIAFGVWQHLCFGVGSAPSHRSAGAVAFGNRLCDRWKLFAQMPPKLYHRHQNRLDAFRRGKLERHPSAGGKTVDDWWSDADAVRLSAGFNVSLDAAGSTGHPGGRSHYIFLVVQPTKERMNGYETGSHHCW